MPEDHPLQACLDELRASEHPAPVHRVADRHAAALLGTPGVALALVAGARDSQDPERVLRLQLYEALIGQACTDLDNRGRVGRRFLDEACMAIERLVASESLDFLAARDLSLAHARAEFDGPDALVTCLMDHLGPLAHPWWEPDDLDAAIDLLRRQADGNNHLLYSDVKDQLSVLSDETRLSFVRHVAAREEDFCGRVAMYWLLDASADLRLAAAGGFLERARSGFIEPASAALVPQIRNWMPPDAARAVLDTALREARRRGLFAPLDRAAERPIRFLAGLPDRSGDQALAAVPDYEAEPAAAVVLIQPRRGFGDAYVINGESARNAIPALETDAHALEVPWEAFEPMLAAALADGLACGRPPPAGLIDVALACGIAAARPRKMTARDWLAEVDPQDAIAGLATTEREDLIKQSAAWPYRHAAVGSWSEGTALFQDALDEASATEDIEAAFWSRMEVLRDDWALLMLRAAHVLKAAADDDWRSFTTTASALLDGRPLETVPIMRYLFRAAADDWLDEEIGIPSDEDDDTV